MHTCRHTYIHMFKSMQVTLTKVVADLLLKLGTWPRAYGQYHSHILHESLASVVRCSNRSCANIH